MLHLVQLLSYGFVEELKKKKMPTITGLVKLLEWVSERCRLGWKPERCEKMRHGHGMQSMSDIAHKGRAHGVQLISSQRPIGFNQNFWLKCCFITHNSPVPLSSSPTFVNVDFWCLPQQHAACAKLCAESLHHRIDR
jgi:hypothetical protein